MKRAQPPVGRLALRVYAFALVTVVLSIVLMAGLLKYVGDPPWLRSYGANVAMFTRQLGERYPDRAVLLAHLDEATRGMDATSAVYQRGGGRLWHSPGNDSDAPTAGEWTALARGEVVTFDDVVIAPIPGHPDLALVQRPNAVFSGLGAAVALCAVLLLVLLASMWFARGMARSIDHLLRTQRALLADISHELRTPLARIRVALELATEDPVAAQDVLSEVGIDLAELEQIIDDLLTVVRLDSPDGAAQLPRGPLTVDELVRRSGERFAAMFPGRTLAITGAPGGGVVHGHGALLRRALDNLLDNAAKYSSGDTPITVGARADGERVVVEVVDRGAGMTAAQLANAFTPFWRADDSRSRASGGVGLGLALARRVARAHGGDVTLRSTPGTGTTATLIIPLAAASASAA